MLKLYEEFIKNDELRNIIFQLKNRVRFWFSEGDLSKDENINLTDIQISTSTKFSKKTLTIYFNNQNYQYAAMITVNFNDPENCKFEIKRYNINTAELIDTIDDEISINDFKEDFLINKISEFEEKSTNPDENKIEISKEEEEEETIPEEEEIEETPELGGEEGAMF